MHVYTVVHGEENTLYVHTASDGKGYSLPRQYCMRAVDGYNLHARTKGDGTGYTSVSTLLAVERNKPRTSILGCALTFASEAKFEIEAKISFRLEAKKKPDFT